MVAYLTLLGALYGLLVGLVTRKRPTWGPLTAGVAWTAIEWLQAVHPFGFPLFLGSTQVGLPWSPALAALGGLGLSGLIVGLGVALAQAGTRGNAGWTQSTRAARWGLVVLVASWVLGAWQPNLREADGPIAIAVVQGGAPNWLYDALPGSRVGELLLEAWYDDPVAQELAAGADLVVLPETALRRATVVRDGLSLVALFRPAWGASGDVAVGTLRAEAGPDGEHRIFNSVLVLDGADGHLVRGVVDKHRLVPVVETGRYARGEIGGAVPRERVRLSAVICWESLDPWLAEERARDANLLLVLTNDAGFEESPIARAHATQGRSRAVELGRPLARAAQAGPSLVTDAHGELLAELPSFAQGIVRTSVRPVSGRTWAALCAPAIGPACWLALLITIAASRRRRPANAESP